MKKLQVMLMALLALAISACQPAYESVDNDPMQTRIYTLDNGLKVYMSVNENEPRIQTYVAVRAGGKNDPAETTGLAHYFEHLMFKGTKQFGTSNYELEKPMLDQIEALYEVYRSKTDPEERAAIYHQIDSISYEASKIFIPNEYDKLMAAIGSEGTNAFTSYDETAYVENIPSNQLENWARIQADRFENSVIRGFHTELETIYEEKNMSLTRDSRKVYEKIFSLLYPNHPYGKQTILGSQEHLKNPSITNIKNFHKTYYVPNNMVICMSGDFNPDQAIKVIKKHFGQLKPNPDVPVLDFEPAQPSQQRHTAEVFGNDAEMVSVAWPFPGKSSKDSEMLSLLDMIVSNGTAGLFDLDINQQQKALAVGCGLYDLADYSTFMLLGYPKQGQSLDEVKDLMLAEIEKLKKGEFDEYLLEASINQFKLQQMRAMENNNSRVSMMLDAFTCRKSWADEVSRLDRLSQVTKEDIVAYANKWLTDGYALVYKRRGQDPNEIKIAKPAITPILTNRDSISDFLAEIKASVVEPIQPAFVDFETAIQKNTIEGKWPLMYIQNTENKLFSLEYRFDVSSDNNKLLPLAFDYLTYLGTSSRSNEDIRKELYRLACDYRAYTNSLYTNVSLSGLADNMPQAIALLDDVLQNAQVDEPAFQRFIEGELKSRADAKLSQSTIFSRLRSYLSYGKESTRNVLNNKELKALKAEDLIGALKSLLEYPHSIRYYGPASQEELAAVLSQHHALPASTKPAPEQEIVYTLSTETPKVLFAHYPAKQIYMSSVSNLNEAFDPSKKAIIDMYNEYFGGGMNGIVFQEMREARGLAYSASARYNDGGRKELPYYMMTYIATQNDKMKDAMDAFDEIINDMPESQAAFSLAKSSLESSLRTERITRASIFSYYDRMQRYGLNYDIRRDVFEALPSLGLEDVKTFQQTVVKNRPYHYAILGDENDLNFKDMQERGKVEKVSLETIFGY